MNEIINQKIELVKREMFSRFPNCPHTISVVLWDDDTFKVECRYGENNLIHTVDWYDNKVEYGVIVEVEDEILSYPDKFGENKLYKLVEIHPNLDDKNKDELIALQEEYTTFLEEEMSKTAVYLNVHGWNTSDEIVQKGQELRDKISNIKINII